MDKFIIIIDIIYCWCLHVRVYRFPVTWISYGFTLRSCIENNAVELLDGNGQVIAKVDGKTGKSSVAVDVKGDLIGYVDVKDGDG